MELPENTKKLYRHWGFHTTKQKKNTDLVPEEIRWFIDERVSMWKQKTSGKAPPYTKDPILSRYRFCNIFRELDRQTIEIHTLLNPLRNNFSLWLLNMFYARMVARPETMHSVGLLSFDQKENRQLYARLAASPRPRYGTPYVFPISVIQQSDTPTRELFISNYLPAVMKGVAHEVQTWQKKSAYEGVEKVLHIFGFPLRFLWTETLIDTAYQFPEYIDLYKRFPIGPGALPTFETLNPDLDPSVFVQKLAEKNSTTDITCGGRPLRLSAENWEGIGCEYRKYTNLKNGHGRRRLFRPDLSPKLF